MDTVRYIKGILLLLLLLSDKIGTGVHGRRGSSRPQGQGLKKAVYSVSTAPVAHWIGPVQVTNVVLMSHFLFSHPGFMVLLTEPSGPWKQLPLEISCCILACQGQSNWWFRLTPQPFPANLLHVMSQNEDYLWNQLCLWVCAQHTNTVQGHKTRLRRF